MSFSHCAKYKSMRRYLPTQIRFEERDTKLIQKQPNSDQEMGHITVLPNYHLSVVMHIVAQHIEKQACMGTCLVKM
jgi:hypothetical protein